MIKIDVKDQILTALGRHAVISTLKETLESRFVNDFFTVMKDSNKLQLYSNLKVLRRKIICDFTNTDQQSLNLAFLHTIETRRWKSIEKDKRICTLCIGN